MVLTGAVTQWFHLVLVLVAFYESHQVFHRRKFCEDQRPAFERIAVEILHGVATNKVFTAMFLAERGRFFGILLKLRRRVSNFGGSHHVSCH